MRTRELNVPVQILMEVAQVIEENQLPAEIMGATDDEEITVEFQYEKESSQAVFEIMELIDQYNEDNEEEEEEEEEE